MVNSKKIWEKASWRNKNVTQQPQWTKRSDISKVLSSLNRLPALVFSGETRTLRSDLKSVQQKKGFVLQMGNCSESFEDCNGPKIHNFLRIFLQMSAVVSIIGNKQIVKIGRIAGQYAKPRSCDTEVIDGCVLPAYRGDIVNRVFPDALSREANAGNLIEAYFRSAATLNLIRAFVQGGYSDIQNLNDWQQHFFAEEIASTAKYSEFVGKMKSSFNSKLDYGKGSHNDYFYISHEALLLEYEEAFARVDTTTNEVYSTSAHMLWVGDRTKSVDGAHVEFLRGINNPIGVKIGPKSSFTELVETIKVLNPENYDNKLILIIRFGREYIANLFPELISIVEHNKLNVIWMLDPMHGNTFKYNEFKVRSFDDICFEVDTFFDLSSKYNVIPGGIHLEMTEENVTECIGGASGLSFSDLHKNYSTKVDPRLNAAQAMELAFLIGQKLAAYG